MHPKTGGCLLVLLSLLLWGSTLCDAALPQFIIPDDTTISEPEQKLEQALRDAITMARVVGTMFDPCEPAFLRYFRSSDAIFVKQVFQVVANIPLYSQIDYDTVVEILSSASVLSDLQPKFAMLELAMGNNPSVPEHEQACEEEIGGSIVMAGSYINPGALGPVALMSLCQSLFQFPTLDEIENPPDSARDAQGNPLPGYTCDGLGDHDTDLMSSPGGTLLHELMHWTFLLEDIPYFAFVIDPNDHNFPQISDFDGPVPEDGYGPYNARLLRLDDPSGPLQNADSYVWYAQSKYWSWKCQKAFGPAVSEGDDSMRSGLRETLAPPVGG